MKIATVLRASTAACLLSAQLAGAQSSPPNPPPAPNVVRVFEFANAQTGRHVWLADPEEIAGVEAGAAGAGWARNGYYFDARQHGESSVDVCRFYAPGPHSHFFTANPQECAALRADGQGWIYEKVAFRASPPPPWSTCGSGTIYRLYNNRWMFNDSAHRFTADRALRQRLIEEGWIDEGIAFCGDSGGRETLRTWVASGREGPRADCDEPGSAVVTCVMARGLRDMARTGPISGDLALLTGFASTGTVFTSQSPDDTAAVRADSLVLVTPPGTGAPGRFGFQLVGANRIAGDLATLGVVHRLPTAAPILAGQADERVFPWGDGRERDLGLSFSMRSEVEGYFADLSQAYGLGLLRFQDRGTGHSLMVTLQAWGRTPPANMLMRDLFTGQPIVSTFFGEATSFGTSEGAPYAMCPERCIVSLRLRDTRYAFRLARGDFLKVIAMARQLDPALSGDPADYLVSSFQFREETYLDATVAFVVDNLTLSLSR